jgi:(p)ppGpp synthase/HD superfamily hydrolase
VSEAKDAPVRDLVDRAQVLVSEAHRGQLDKQGRDYYQHHLALVAAILRPFGPEAEAAGWLHDVIEDTEATYDVLIEWGFPAEVIDAVDAVTRRDGETYTDLIERAAGHPLGRLVKLADNWVNLTGLDDLAKVDPEAAVRLRGRYEEARVVLERSLLDSRP